MKRIAIVLLCLVLLLTAGCAKQEPVVTTEATTQPTTVPAETTAPPTEPLPQTEEATILADHVPAILSILSRGDTVDVVGEYDEEHYVIKTKLGYGLVEKSLLSMPDDEAYEAWTGYSRWNRNVYDNYRLSGTPVQVLKTNTKIEVLDDLGGCCAVKVEDVTGFMKLEDISKYPIRSQSSSGGDGGSGGGSGGGGGSSGGGGGGQDGGDISLRFNGGIVLLSAITQEGSVTGQATVRADGTEVVLGYFDRDETAQVVVESGFAEEWEGYATVMMDDLYAHVPETLIQRKGEEAYAQWDGFAKYNTMFYDNFYLQGEGKRLNTNTAIHVVADLDTCYLVTVDESFGYVAKTMVSEKKIVTKKAPVESGGGGGGSSGSGGGGGGQEWSDPVL
ncbi:MAG: hypothetical protein ACI3V5_05230 [Faecousia sp.]